MKVAVYTIVKNEEKFLERWYNSAKDADYIMIADTGSTDNTVEIANKLGIHVEVIRVLPWRFDDARNAALSLIPEDIDYCIPLDADEVLTEGWRVGLEREFEKGITRPRYHFVWSWNNGNPDIEFYGNKIHARRGFRWRHPVHEVVYAYDENEVESFSDDIHIYHLPDPEKSRGQYFPMLAMAVREDPHDDRNSFYYARELYFHSMYQEAIVEFTRFLTLSHWDAERAAAYRFMSKCDPQRELEYLLSSLKETPRRETMCDITHYYYVKEDWERCLEYAQKTLAITQKPFDYLSEGYAWGSLPYDLMSVAQFNLNQKEESLASIKKALEFNPDDERMLANLNYVESLCV